MASKPAVLIFGKCVRCRARHLLTIFRRFEHLLTSFGRSFGSNRGWSPGFGMFDCPHRLYLVWDKHYSPCALLTNTLSTPQQRESQHLRINLHLNSSCSYIGSEFTKVLQRPEVEYRQVNLTIPGAPQTIYSLLGCSSCRQQPQLLRHMMFRKGILPLIMYSISPERCATTEQNL